MEVFSCLSFHSFVCSLFSYPDTHIQSNLCLAVPVKKNGIGHHKIFGNVVTCN